VAQPIHQRVIFFLLAAGLAGIDWWSKRLMQETLQTEAVIPVFEGLRFVLVYNHGAAFGFLSSAGGWQRGLFILLAVMVSIYLGYRLWLARPDERHFNLGLVFILGGALGNLIDRIILGYVVDFIDIYFQNWHWPAFNVADIAISVGAGIVILDSFGLGRASGKKDSS